jgi:hypothetical protein
MLVAPLLVDQKTSENGSHVILQAATHRTEDTARVSKIGAHRGKEILHAAIMQHVSTGSDGRNRQPILIEEAVLIQSCQQHETRIIPPILVQLLLEGCNLLSQTRARQTEHWEIATNGTIH